MLVAMKARLLDIVTTKDITKLLYDLKVCPMSQMCMSCLLNACVVLCGLDCTVCCQYKYQVCLVFDLSLRNGHILVAPGLIHTTQELFCR